MLSGGRPYELPFLEYKPRANLFIGRPENRALEAPVLTLEFGGFDYPRRTRDKAGDDTPREGRRTP